jgi:hypothetical protein
VVDFRSTPGRSNEELDPIMAIPGPIVFPMLTEAKATEVTREL